MRKLESHEIEAVNGGCSFITDLFKKDKTEDGKSSGGILDKLFGGDFLKNIGNIFTGLFGKNK
ncbi:hypothetical protein [Pragia fontium]|uniref:Bacteriocin leader domain-containing protein n=2 Tax=Pragia fontium TaxID=82985 RepID=A0AAJ4W8Z9_9GAMM|nr:hypothetical protein [Pragia fontium]AKJ41833.1 hypothetical protein QQ39_06830 [Pragia fontium]SFC36545.1 hypothetical protein SAMN02745723_102185 [Pragia fontium DSM 5563 = ATCC 49100]SUB82052.1 Uncharacterised protein [Pragia fontium]VEJ54676.1 Uncharacterised protein [Pragia fontium]GKX62150.1 hypothetical protein SOASR032_07190 [Pragia fontium]